MYGECPQPQHDVFGLHDRTEGSASDDVPCLHHAGQDDSDLGEAQVQSLQDHVAEARMGCQPRKGVG